MRTLILMLISLWGWNVSATGTANLNKNGVILDGFDVVSYFKSGMPVQGDPKFQAKYNDVIYWFANDDDKSLFLKTPEKYQPQFGGWCAYAVADSKSKVDVDPKSFVIQDGRLLLFYNGLWGNTREKWLHTSGKDPKTYLQEADANWPAVKTKEP